jgi:cholinesterase
VQYRLNIFGFPGTPNGPKNVALEDQRLAVEWVRDNIAAFGGDASKISIMGQSSGGVAVDYWAYTYLTEPIVAGLISHSGNALSFSTNN